MRLRLGLPASRRQQTFAALGGIGLLALGAAGWWATRRSDVASAVGVVAVERGRLVREVTALGVLKAVKATPILVPSDPPRSRKIARLAPNGSFVKAGETVIVFDAVEATRELANGEADRATAENKMASARATGAKSREDIESDGRRASEDRHRAQDVAPTEEGIFSRHEIISSSIDRELLDKRVTIAGTKLDANASSNRAEVALGAVERAKADLRIRQAKAALSALDVAAPYDGLFVLERSWNGEMLGVGNDVWPGQKVAEIPDLSQLEARVYVLEADAFGLAPGRHAAVVIEGKPDVSYAAKITRVDSIAKPQGWGSPVKYFETILALERQEPAIMKPGQRVKARIVLEELDGVLTVPRGALCDKDGKRVVYRLAGGRFSPVEVSVGSSSLARVVITAGLAQGERVALRDPTRALKDILKARAAGPAEEQAGGAR